jgi:hypothetical protein
MSQQFSAEAIQLEAREQQIRAALGTLKKALQVFKDLRGEALCDHCQEFSGDLLSKGDLAIQVAMKQLGGEA